MSFLASLLLGVPTGLYGLYYIQTTLGDWGEELVYVCREPTILSSFPRWGSLMCLYTHVFKYAQHDILGLSHNWVFLNAFGVVLIIMLIEGSRRSFANTSLAWVGFWGMLANIFGISGVFPAMWMPIFFYYQSRKKNLDISAERANGALLGIIVGYTFPTFAMLLLSLYRPDSYQEEVVIALWQLSPLCLFPLTSLFARATTLVCPPSANGLDDETLARLRITQGVQATERLYLFQGVLNLIIYAATYAHTQFQGLHLKDALLMLANKEVPVGLSFEQLGGFLSSHLLFVDFAVMNIGIFLWVLLQDGILYGLVLLLGFVLIGPGAATAFYAAHRERRIQPAQEVTKKNQ